MILSKEMTVTLPAYISISSCKVKPLQFFTESMRPFITSKCIKISNTEYINIYLNPIKQNTPDVFPNNCSGFPYNRELSTKQLVSAISSSLALPLIIVQIYVLSRSAFFFE